MKKKAFGLLLIMLIFLYGCGTKERESVQKSNEITSEDAATENSSDSANTFDAENAPVAENASVAENTSHAESTSDEENSSETEETSKPFTIIESAVEDWGAFTPDTSENDFVKAVMQIETYETAGLITQTYEADYDGNGKKEAFVVCGEYAGSDFVGDLWFVDETISATCIEKNMYAYMSQVYYKDFQQVYLLFSHSIGNPVVTEMYTVKSGEAVNITEGYPNQRWVDDQGYIITVQDAYDTFYEKDASSEEVLWTGHTWKFYPFYFFAGELTEVEALKTTFEAMDKMAPLPEELLDALKDTEEKKVAATQFIYRERTRQMLINIAYDLCKDETVCYQFSNFIFHLSEDSPQNWELVEKGNGIYNIRFSGESFWEFTDGL